MKVDVALGDRSYPIHLDTGLLNDQSLWRDLLSPSQKVVVVSNDTVAAHYLAALSATLKACGKTVVTVVIPDGETHKQWASIEHVITEMLVAQCDRHCTLVSLGGGVIGDLTGFAAAIFMRGVRFVQVPTSLLAQVDAAVGGKTGINHRLGKNMVGAFHQPSAVVMDLATLQTLPAREFRCGIAEMVKHGAILDASYFAWLEEHMEAVVNKDAGLLAQAIAASCTLKAQVVARDEREQGDRALLNFGHTFAHVIETATDYSYLHGEAVAAGMVLAARLSQRVLNLPVAVTARLTALLERAGLPLTAPALSLERWAELLSHDKKNRDGQVRFVLLEALGRGRPLIVEPPHWQSLFT